MTRARELAARLGTADRRALGALRLLGARHLVQGALLMARPSPLAAAGGAAVDLTHAATMLVVAVLRPDLRRLALTSATEAGLTGMVSVRAAHGPAGRRRT